MDKSKVVLTDVLIFAVIVMAGLFFGMSNAGVVPVLIGRGVCFVSSIAMAWSLAAHFPGRQ